MVVVAVVVMASVVTLASVSATVVLSLTETGMSDVTFSS